MRTTIEMSDDHRAALLEMAARRRLKGFSDLVAEALDAYLMAQSGRDERIERALRACGSLTDTDAEDLRAHIAAARPVWRSQPLQALADD